MAAIPVSRAWLVAILRPTYPDFPHAGWISSASHPHFRSFRTHTLRSHFMTTRAVHGPELRSAAALASARIMMDSAR